MTELVNLVDHEGRLQRAHVPRDQIEITDQLHLEIVIAIVFDSMNRVLAQQRSWKKKSLRGYVDHAACGAIISNSDKNPIAAAYRELREETGVKPDDLRIIDSRVNPYGHYRHLAVGRSDAPPVITRPHEVEQVGYLHPMDIKRMLGRFCFVAGFFDDLALAAKELDIRSFDSLHDLQLVRHNSQRD